MCMSLLLGGNEFTTHLLGSTIITLLAHPDELAKVLAELLRIPQLIEEMLRYELSVQAIFRSATVILQLLEPRSQRAIKS
jgi:cytochrome P450